VSLRAYATAAATAGLLAVVIPVADASAAGASAPPAPPAPPVGFHMPAFNFVPPSVGPISVDIGRTIINGQIISQGVHVLMPGTTVPPLGGTTVPPVG
jgi:hypothetical protein